MARMTRPPFALEGIDHILLLVSGMDSAVRFYTEVLGCTVEGALPQYGMLQLRAGAALIDLVDIAAQEASWPSRRLAADATWITCAWRSPLSMKRSCGGIWRTIVWRSSRKGYMAEVAARAYRSTSATRQGMSSS